jgi:hypothetical protein
MLSFYPQHNWASSAKRYGNRYGFCQPAINVAQANGNIHANDHEQGHQRRPGQQPLHLLPLAPLAAAKTEDG